MFMRIQSGAVRVLVCILGLVSGGCFNESVISPPVFTVGPSVSDNPNPHVPLAGIVTAETDVPATLEVQVEEGGSTP
jgi:hypothetical protein